MAVDLMASAGAWARVFQAELEALGYTCTVRATVVAIEIDTRPEDAEKIRWHADAFRERCGFMVTVHPPLMPLDQRCTQSAHAWAEIFEQELTARGIECRVGADAQAIKIEADDADHGKIRHHLAGFHQRSSFATIIVPRNGW